MKLKEKIAIVTGGGRGIRKAIAEAFAREWAKVVVTAARQRNEIEEGESNIGKMMTHALLNITVSEIRQNKYLNCAWTGIM